MEESVAMSEPLPCPSGADWENKSALAFLTHWPIFFLFSFIEAPTVAYFFVVVA